MDFVHNCEGNRSTHTCIYVFSSLGKNNALFHREAHQFATSTHFYRLCVFKNATHCKSNESIHQYKKINHDECYDMEDPWKKKRKTLFAKCKKSIQKTTRCVIPHTQNVQERRTHQDRSRADVARAVGRGPANEHRMSFL